MLSVLRITFDIVLNRMNLDLQLLKKLEWKPGEHATLRLYGGEDCGPVNS